ncbi:MAG: hypothetical protein ACRDTA_02710 [Pseudonocardiaceae bacterium]
MRWCRAAGLIRCTGTPPEVHFSVLRLDRPVQQRHHDAGESAHHVAQCLLRLRLDGGVQAARRVVEHGLPGVLGDCPGQTQALELATGQWRLGDGGVIALR